MFVRYDGGVRLLLQKAFEAPTPAKLAEMDLACEKLRLGLEAEMREVSELEQGASHPVHRPTGPSPVDELMGGRGVRACGVPAGTVAVRSLGSALTDEQLEQRTTQLDTEVRWRPCTFVHGCGCSRRLGSSTGTERVDE